uniref:phage tail protein n=1 Tax=uncultured Sphingomonas sp. TaxID=158754 RepID=UPI0035CA0B24
MTSAAALLPPPARPPHDPLSLRLGGDGGWPAALIGSDTDSDGCALILPSAPGAARLLSEASGSLGGLVPPRNVAVDDAGFVWLLGARSGKLKRFDPCSCAFVTMPCTAGIGKGARALTAPGGIAIDGATIFVCDAGVPGRVLLFDRRSFALRAEWRPPTGAVANPWQPVAITIRRDIVYVADPANGCVHRFQRWGGWRGTIDSLGAVAALAFDCHGRLFAVVPGLPSVVIVTAPGSAFGTATLPREVAADFAHPPFPVAADGTIDLSGSCATAGSYDRDGEPVAWPAPPSPAFATNATWTSSAIDSRIARCVWHRVQPDAALGLHQGVALSTYTAEAPVPDDVVALLPDSAWTAVPWSGAGDDALILSPPGRYLWLRVRLSGDGGGTPRLCATVIEFPRISLRRYLPAAFGSDPVSADFTDRLLAIFDRGFRDIESRIDNGAALFDPGSAPAGKANDILGWIGSWIGLTVERGWSEARRRAIVKAAGKLFACRGTVQGLRRILLLWLGWDDLRVQAQRPACGPRCRPAARAPLPPTLVLEHWKLRRWLWLGRGRLGSDAVVWGESILGRSRLDDTAQADVTRLDTTRNPLLDPLNVAANRASVFLPARTVGDPRKLGMVRRLIQDLTPADVLVAIVPVHARMRIGIQASIGFDSVVGCWPAGVTLDRSALGRATILTGPVPGGRDAASVGRTARLRPSPHSSRGS